MSELVSPRIRATAAKLGLPHLAESLNQYASRADEAKMGYLDFLDLVLAEELAIRDDRGFRQGLRLFRLPHTTRRSTSTISQQGWRTLRPAPARQ